MASKMKETGQITLIQDANRILYVMVLHSMHVSSNAFVLLSLMGEKCKQVI